MIDCDRVFDVLTRGPFPTGGADDAAVEAHLERCHECARLAAALRPAIELFEEAIGPDEGHDLPSYWGDVAVESSERRAASADTARQIRRQIRRPLVHYSHAVGQFRSSSVWQVAALVALGVFIGCLLRSFAPSDAGRMSGGIAPTATAASEPNGRGQSLATAPKAAANSSSPSGEGDTPAADGNTTVWVPLACLGGGLNKNVDELADPQTSGRQTWVQRRFVDLDHCCTECHNNAPETIIPVSATAQVQKSCRYCHVN